MGSSLQPTPENRERLRVIARGEHAKSEEAYRGNPFCPVTSFLMDRDMHCDCPKSLALLTGDETYRCSDRKTFCPVRAFGWPETTQGMLQAYLKKTYGQAVP